MFEEIKNPKKGSKRNRGHRCSECSMTNYNGICDVTRNNVNSDGNCPYFHKKDLSNAGK